MSYGMVRGKDEDGYYFQAILDGWSGDKLYYTPGDVLGTSKAKCKARDQGLGEMDKRWLGKNPITPEVFLSYYVPPKWDPEETWCVPREMVEKVLRN